MSVPSDGSYGQTRYFGSGALTAQAVAAAFAPYLARLTVGVAKEDFDGALGSARAGQFTYLLYPEILHWEDRATEWSGRPDQAAVKLTVVRVDNGVILDSAVVGGKSGLATFGGDRPEHLLPKPLADYAASLSSSAAAIPRANASQETAAASRTKPTTAAVTGMPESPVASQLPGTSVATATEGPRPPRIGQSSFEIERMGREKKCDAEARAWLLSQEPGVELYTYQCNASDTWKVRCEFRQCRIVK